MPDLRAIDANIILRYVLNDVPDQAQRARRLIESSERLGLTVIALAEVAWILTGPRYGMERGLIAGILLRLIARGNVVAIGYDKAQAQAALLACTQPIGAAGFGDALIAACARSLGVREIYSFDQRFARAGLTPVLPL